MQQTQAPRYKFQNYKTGDARVDQADQWLADNKVPFGTEPNEQLKKKIQEKKHIVYEYYDKLSVGELLNIICNGRVSQYLYQLAVYKVKQKTGADLFKIHLNDVQ